MPNEKVESATQTNQNVIVLDKEKYENLIAKANTVPFDMKIQVATLSQKCYQLFGNSTQPEMNLDKMEKICHEISLKKAILCRLAKEENSLFLSISA